MSHTICKNDIWKTCFAMFKHAVHKALTFAQNGECEVYQGITPTKKEFAANSRYLHRGFYCPSPAFHIVVSNSKKGKLLKQPTKRSNITHIYHIHNEDIYMVEYFLNNTPTGKEYIQWDQNIRFGYVFNHWGQLGGVSVETYNNGQLQNYMWAICHNASSSSEDWQADFVHFEAYQYEDSALISFDLCFVALIEEAFEATLDASELVDHERYQAIYNNGQITDVKRI